MQEDNELMLRVRAHRHDIEQFIYWHLLPKVLHRETRRTSHMREWYRLPMNYVRMIELPLTLSLLDLQKGHAILDTSSPKLLSLFLAAKGYNNLTVSDLCGYFVEDFRVFSKAFKTPITTAVFDATQMPYADATFDRIFSVSVFEHIPGDGDARAAAEVARTLKPGGLLILTLPAWTSYCEEWVNDPSFYWPSIKREDGASFYQRRYDANAIEARFAQSHLVREDTVFIAEHPLEPPRLSSTGMMKHNMSVIEAQPKSGKWRSRIPLHQYFAQRRLSRRCHYLTRDAQDPNIRQVAIRFRRA